MPDPGVQATVSKGSHLTVGTLEAGIQEPLWAIRVHLGFRVLGKLIHYNPNGG